jgi:tRNA threonylcarbamoyladenosine biosynthesis protein TsaB
MILAIETSTDQGSIAVCNGDECIRFETFVAARGHGGALFLALERIFSDCVEIRQIVVGLGPGSYSGVRIALAAATGLAMSNGAVLTGLPSPVAYPCGHCLVLGDARRDTFYLTEVANGRCIEGPMLLDRAAVEARLAGWRGDVLGSEPFSIAPRLSISHPDARLLAATARKWPGELRPAPLEPIYLRDPHITQPAVRPDIPHRPRRADRP